MNFLNFISDYLFVSLLVNLGSPWGHQKVNTGSSGKRMKSLKGHDEVITLKKVFDITFTGLKINELDDNKNLYVSTSQLVPHYLQIEFPKSGRPDLDASTNPPAPNKRLLERWIGTGDLEVLC